MEEQKKYLESIGWTCSKCGCNGSPGYDCINNSFKNYMITVKASGIMRIFLNGRIIASSALANLKKKMEENNLV